MRLSGETHAQRSTKAASRRRADALRSTMPSSNIRVLRNGDAQDIPNNHLGFFLGLLGTGKVARWRVSAPRIFEVS